MFYNGFGYDFVLGWQFCALARADPDSYRENRKLAEARLAASKTAELKMVKPFVLLKVSYFLKLLHGPK